MSVTEQTTNGGLLWPGCVKEQGRNIPMHSISEMRYLASGGVLWIAILVAPALTIWNLVVHNNGYIGVLQWTFVVLMAPELIRSVRSSLAGSFAFRFLVIGFLVCMAGWLAQGLRLEEVDRTSFYVVQPLFVLAACAWFQWAGDAGLRSMYRVKLIATAGAVAYLFLMLWLADVPEIDLRKVKPLPIYRHIRHLGYDLAVVASLGAVFWAARPSASRLGNWILFLVIGYVSLRSGGRGQILNFLAFIAIAACVIPGWKARSALAQALTAFFLGGVMLYLLNPESISWFMGRTAGGTPEQVSSGRTEIWLKVAELVSADWLRLLVGLGPEAFVRHRVMPGLVQAHNAGVQVVLEFGLVGLAALAVALIELARKTWPLLRRTNRDVVFAGAVASLLALLLYSLVDGIFYHAAPFLASMLLIAFILTRCANAGRAGGT